jgi:hypothetical protein
MHFLQSCDCTRMERWSSPSSSGRGSDLVQALVAHGAGPAHEVERRLKDLDAASAAEHRRWNFHDDWQQKQQEEEKQASLHKPVSEQPCTTCSAASAEFLAAMAACDKLLSCVPGPDRSSMMAVARQQQRWHGS